MELYDHQTQALRLLKGAVQAGKRRIVLQAPTGWGKTNLAVTIINGALAKGNQIVFTVPKLQLIDQTVDVLWSHGVNDLGVIQANHELTSGLRPVQVASVQTLMRRDFPTYDVVVIDECHIDFKFYHGWMLRPEWRDIPFIGLSATPWTKGLGKHWDHLIIASTTRELIDAGYLSPFKAFAPSHPDLSGVKIVAGDYHEGQLSTVMSDRDLVADVVETWREKAENRPTLCFAVDRAHARQLCDRFTEAGIPSGYVDFMSTTEERRAIEDGFRDGSLKVVCNVNVLTTGVDWDVRCIILARPTRSEILYVQMLGRGLRTAEGKDHCLILDHSTSTERLGFVTDIHHEHLDDGKPKKVSAAERKTPLPKMCPKCSFLKPPGMAQCPVCGFAPTKQSPIEALPGELTEISPRRSRATKQEWYSMLLFVGDQRGYKRGWAANQYREKFGVWPRGLSDVSIPPSFEIVGWVRSRQIAYAKARQKAAMMAVRP